MGGEFPMPTVIALTQFILLTLGTLGVNIMAKASMHDVALGVKAHSLAGFLVNYSIWLFLVPVVWTVYARVSMIWKKGFFSPNVAQAIGVALIVFIIALYGYAIFFYF
jgi:hypothetical protein